MDWWGWLLLGALTAIVVGVVVWALFFRSRGGQTTRIQVLESEKARLEAERQAEEAAKEKAERICRILESEILEIAHRRRVRLEEIKDETIKDFVRFVDDPDALLARVDEIVGRSTHTDNKPGGGQGEGGQG